MSKKKIIIFVYFLIIFACQPSNNTPLPPQEDYKHGSISISIDESYQPILESLLQVHQSSFPNAKIKPFFKPENHCLKDLTNDSFRLIITSKRITPEEEQIISDQIGFKPAYGIIAYDAIAVILNNTNKDSTFTINQIKDILTGKNQKYIPIFDGLSQSSIFRYLNDNLLKNAAQNISLKGTPNSKELLNFVSKNKNAIGFIGVSWVGNKEDSLQLSFQKNIRIAAIECQNCPDKSSFVKPYQANLITNKYPFLREIHYILKENFMGVGRGFVNFMSNERGQLIFKRAYLVPAKINFNIRNVKIRE